jgi:hypothetical protein
MSDIPAVIEALLGEDYDSRWLYTVPLAGDHEVGVNYLDAKKVVGTNPDWDSLLTD